MSASHFAYGSPAGERRGRITDEFAVETCDGTVIGAVRRNTDTGRWHAQPEPAAWPLQPRVARTFASRSQAARWLATTHAVSQGWAS